MIANKVYPYWTLKCLMKKAVLQNKMAFDFITASQGDTCAIIQKEYYVFIPDESANESSLLNHTDTNECPEWSNPQPKGFNKSRVWILGLLVEKVVSDLGNYCLNPCFLLRVPARLLWHLPPMQPASLQKSCRPANETPCRLLRNHYRKKVTWFYKSCSWRMECWKTSSKGRDCWLTRDRNPGTQRHLIPCLEHGLCLSSPHLEAALRT